jgi:hypothetical protein
MPSNYVYEGSGGISVGGPKHYTLNVDYEAVSGGLVFGGSADYHLSLFNSTYTYVGSGGISLGGPSVEIVDYGTSGSGGARVGGSAVATVSSSVNAGGTTAYVYVGSGGISISGPNDDIIDYGYCADAKIPIRIGGSAQTDVDGIVVTSNHIYTMSGGIVLGGQVEEMLANYTYTMSGGIIMGGGAAFENEIHIDISIGWNTFAIITVDIPIGWNTGNTPLFFYRVEGVCEPIQCPPIADNDPANKHCNYTFIKNIVASNVCDVCTQLADTRFLRTIKSIKQFSNPARESDILAFEALGKIDPLCNNLTPVDFCQCPPCAQFCDYEKATVTPVTQKTVTVTENVYLPGMTYYYSNLNPSGVFPSGDGNCYILYEYFYYTYENGKIKVFYSETYRYNCPSTTTTTTTTTTMGPSYGVTTTGRVRIGGEAIVSWKPNEVPLKATTGQVVTDCGCNVPTEIYFTHDLGKTNKLSNFLKRNGLSLPRTTKLSYSMGSSAWFTNITYKGVGLDGSSNERWSLILSLECTNVVDGRFDVGNPFFWKLVLLVRQQNESKNSTNDTRLQVNMTDGGPCERGELAVSAYINVSTVKVQPIDPPKIDLGATLSDKIGLFQGPSWVSNPRFFIGLSVHDVNSKLNSIQFGPLYPQIEVSRLN